MSAHVCVCVLAAVYVRMRACVHACVRMRACGRAGSLAGRWVFVQDDIII